MPSISSPLLIPVSQAAGAAAPDLALVPGTVIDARVLAMRSANMVRIAIEGLAIDVLSEVMLQPGASLKLAVSQATDGVRLTIVSQAQAADGAGAPHGPATIASGAIADQPRTAQMAQGLPSAMESAALARAVQAAAPKQAGLSPLFANLPVIVASESLPQPVQSAAAQLLGARLQLDTMLTGDDVRQAFQKSGLFLESSLARGGTMPSGMPDLKAGLIVLRQVLSNWLGQAAPANAPVPQATPQGMAADAPRMAAPPLAPAAAALTDAVLQQNTPGLMRVIEAALRNATARTLQDLGNAPPPRQPETAAMSRNTAADLQATEPAPPFRGAAPSAQPVARPSIDSDMPSVSMGRQLLDQTDAAIARQTLLQIASLPDRPEFANPNQTVAAQRWSFEIPFAMPQGTAVAQFEIARDGGKESDEGASSSRVWRARFSLDVEPAGPVHALISLVGDKTAVRMWAERPETATQLRASTDALGLALRQAELEPGDIIVGEGAPPRPAKRAGHFLDRAT